MSAYLNFIDSLLNGRRNKVHILNETSDKPISLSIYNDDVRKAFSDLSKLIKSKFYSVIGGISVGKYTKPRNTMDIDLIVKDENEVDIIENEIKSKFKRTRKHAFEHKVTGVEVEILTPEFLNIDKKLIASAIADSVNDNGINVVIPKYLIALKLQRALDEKNPKSLEDKFDIANIIKEYGKIDVDGLSLSKEMIALYDDLLKTYNKK